MTNEISQQRMPGRLKLTLGILVFQVLANGFIGFLIVDEISTRSSHGARTPNSGLLYFIGFLSIAIALTLLACVLMAGTRRAWIRMTVIGIEVVGLISGVINLFSGQVTAIAGIALAIGVLSILNRDDVREWFSE
ncbi:hypothetical protein LWC34_51220 [Kibdelosporangium philippinense]|uniref:Uncharacterized protein n=1 Tax=Kibdelosporangium philippinense TaxID=211113 RepID=A0ABS8ZU59_9PSEU|nr:hypothetical protein [Kibdelosporangium philippinense]MCE7011124.1 hypothetical protein [Kibdelosporangium philippinense]